MVGLEEARAESSELVTNDRHATGAAGEPFVMADGDGALVARGVRRVLPAVSRASVGAAAAALLDGARDGTCAALVVGALPFAEARPARLFQPRSVRRLAPAALARELGERDAPGDARQAGSVLRVAAEPERSMYEELVAETLARLGNGSRGTLRKVVLSRTLEVCLSDRVDVRALLSRLYEDRSATTFCVPLGDSRTALRSSGESAVAAAAPESPGAAPFLVGATPELLLDRRGTRVVSRPLAGSTRRRSDARADRAAGGALARSAKDRLEHALVVEHVADTLAPHCSELRVPRAPELTSTSTMWHLGTTVEGTLRDADVTALDLAAELHPTPAVCGLPRDLAMAAIHELEPFDRGYFAGAVGWCDERGDGRWMVAIRCAEVDGASARLYAGAGIVAGSEPGAEAAETAAKFATMLRALGAGEATGAGAGAGATWRDP